jgi:hypothetical protein
MPAFRCQRCGAPVTIAAPIPRDAECDTCRHDLRCCRNCRHYDTAYNNACRETEAEPVADKERRNFCEFFEFNPTPFAGRGGQAPTRTRADEARAKLDALFKKRPDAG